MPGRAEFPGHYYGRRTAMRLSSITEYRLDASISRESRQSQRGLEVQVEVNRISLSISREYLSSPDAVFSFRDDAVSRHLRVRERHFQYQEK